MLKLKSEELGLCSPAARAHHCFLSVEGQWLEFEEIIALKTYCTNGSLYQQVAKCLAECVNIVITALGKGKFEY